MPSHFMPPSGSKNALVLRDYGLILICQAFFEALALWGFAALFSRLALCAQGFQEGDSALSGGASLFRAAFLAFRGLFPRFPNEQPNGPG